MVGVLFDIAVARREQFGEARTVWDLERRTLPAQRDSGTTLEGDAHFADAVVGAARILPIIGEIFVLIHRDRAAVFAHHARRFVDIAPSRVHEVSAWRTGVVAVLADNGDAVHRDF